MTNELIGLLAALLTTSAFIPQVYQVWKTKSTKGLSLSTLIIFQTGTLLWFIYGNHKTSIAIISSSSITGV